MQDSTFRYQHQMRCEKSNPHVQDLDCEQNQICQQVRDLSIVKHVYGCDLPLLQHTNVCSLPCVILRTPSKNRVSETSTLWTLRPFLPRSHSLVTCHSNMLVSTQYLP
jgi:hypothetical protein